MYQEISRIWNTLPNRRLSVTDHRKNRKARRRLLTEPEYQNILRSLDNQHVQLIVRTMWATQMRLTELLSIRMIDVNLDKGLLHLQDWQHSNLVLSPDLCQELREYCDLYRVGCTSEEPFFCIGRIQVTTCMKKTAKVLNWNRPLYPDEPTMQRPVE